MPPTSPPFDASSTSDTDTARTRVALDGVVRYFESITAERVEELRQLYTADAYFRDPFNEVRGIDDIVAIFHAMYGPLIDPRFKVHESIIESQRAFITWDFTFRIRRFRPKVMQTIAGSSLLRFNTEGRVEFHRDYWDAAGELYSKLPIVGGLMRMLARQMGHQ
jgi:steroid Delta-isomerase